VRPDARLLLVGDPDQLTSVDAGAVLADLVARPVEVIDDPLLEWLVGSDLAAADDPEEAALSPLEKRRLTNGIVRLSRGRRFGGTIAELAVAVRDGNADRVLELLTSGEDDVSFLPPTDVGLVRADVVASSAAVTEAAVANDAAGALLALEAHKLLCAHRLGPFGVSEWARRAAEWAGAPPSYDGWYAGQPLLVTKNDHDAKVYNGDTGVVVKRTDGSLVAAFGRGSTPVLLHPGRLADVQTVYAMTIHRSQGSQYDTVSVVLPDTASSLLTRELLYTAITRARKHVRVLGTEQSVHAAVERQVLRASGLRRIVRD
jgi:exodeoxyribonuclease V alpha subunit